MLSGSFSIFEGSSGSDGFCFSRGPEIETQPDSEPSDSIKQKAGHENVAGNACLTRFESLKMSVLQCRS